MKADIILNGGSVHRTIGRVKDGKPILWSSEEEVRSFVKFLNVKGYSNVNFVRVIEDGKTSGNCR
jgi:hypothetical protein